MTKFNEKYAYDICFLSSYQREGTPLSRLTSNNELLYCKSDEGGQRPPKIK